MEKKNSLLLAYMNPREKHIADMIEFAGQLGALMSFVQLIDTVQGALPRREDGPAISGENARTARRVDGLQRNALGRKRRPVES